MALITTYATLQTAVANELDRSDLTEPIKNAIQLAEGRLKRDQRVRDWSNSSAALTALSDSNTSNWLLTAYPDVYFFATLCEIETYNVEDERIPMWAAKLEQTLVELGTARLNPARSLGLTTYAELRTAVGDWLNRPDAYVAIPLFIVLAERRLRKDQRVRKYGDSSVTFNLASGTNWLFTDHPDIYLYAAVIEGLLWSGATEDPRLPIWESALEERLEQVQNTRADQGRSLTLTTYAGFQRVVADWLDRPDLEPVLPTAIILAEAALNRDDRVRNLEVNAFTIDADDESVPTGFKQLDSWAHNGPTYFGQIDIVGAGELGRLKGLYGATGVPRYAAVVDTVFRFAPVANASFATKMTFWQGITALSGGLNWLYSAHPDIYLYATLIELGPYLKTDPRGGSWLRQQLTTWREEKEMRIAQLHKNNWIRQWGGGHIARTIEPIG